MTAPIQFRPPKELIKAWADEAAKIPPFTPTVKLIAMRVHFACDEIGRQWRIAQVQK